MNNARGAEKMPCESYLVMFNHKCSGLMKKKSPLQDDMRCWCNSKLFYETVNSLSHRPFLNRLTESAAEHPSAWHHVFETELVWRGNLIQIEVACTGDTLFREFLGGIPGGVWHKPAGVEDIHIGRGSKVLQSFRRDKQRSLGVYRPGRGLHTIRARHAHKGGKTKRGRYHIELSAAKCWLRRERRVAAQNARMGHRSGYSSKS